MIGGVFFAFSTFIMHALRNLPSHHGILAMQQVNRSVLNLIFLGVFLGSVGVSITSIAMRVSRWSESGSAMLVAGGVCYLIFTFGVTVLFNVPLNNVLASVQPDAPSCHESWTRYATVWTRWNHMRTAGAALAAAAFACSFKLSP